MLENREKGLTITYQSQPDVEPYARTVMNITAKSEKRKRGKRVRSQREVIYDLMSGNYQSVFDDFLVRYSLPANFDLSKKFQLALKQADKTLTFRNKE